MKRLWPLCLIILLLLSQGSQALGAGQKTAALRQAHGLIAFTPPEKFLAGNFAADELNPSYIFGTVQDFAASRKCPTAWCIEAGEKKRLAAPASPNIPLEYTLYLEEACPDRVVYYVFVDQSALNPQQWLEWRRQFHKSKADPTFGAAKAKLEQALKEGCGVSGELRYILQDGELLGRAPEEVLRVDLKFAPVYDLNRQKKLSR
jgi:hypothetical protein